MNSYIHGQGIPTRESGFRIAAGSDMFVLFLLMTLSGGTAGNWTGALVDSRCYAGAERNVNPTDTETAVDRDGASEVRYCAPGGKTKQFAIVQRDGASLRLDAAGNALAADLVRSRGRKPLTVVDVRGELRDGEIQVTGLDVAQ